MSHQAIQLSRMLDNMQRKNILNPIESTFI